MSSVSRERVANASTIRGITVVLARICPSWTMRMALMRSAGGGLQQDPPRARFQRPQGPILVSGGADQDHPFSPHLSIWSKRAVAPDVR